MPLPVLCTPALVGILSAAALDLVPPPRRPGPPPAAPAETQLAQLHYPGGGDWYANPSSLPNLARQLRERLAMDVDSEIAQPTAMDDDLFAHPFIHMTGHGNVRFTDDEVRRLRMYLTHGGFLYADDNYGMDESLRRELRRIFPDDELVEVPFDHEIYRSVYEFPKGPPKIHEHHGGPPKGLAIFHDGRMAVYYTYNTDIGDGIEDADVHNDPAPVREQAMRMAINVVAYALTH